MTTPVTPEQITTHPEGGWIITGRCGRPHLAGRRWSWWRCRTCLDLAERQRMTRSQRRAAA